MINKANLLINKTIKVYDDFAEQYANYADAVLPQFFLNKFISMLEGKKVLDIGCGSGRDVRYFGDMGLKAVGIDMSNGILQQAMKRGKDSYCLMDMKALGIMDASFDGIWAMASLLHVRKADAPLVLAEMHRVLKASGLIYVSLKEGNGEMMKESRSLPGKERFYSFYRQQEIEQLIEENGFEILSSTAEMGSHENYISIYAKKR